MKTITPLFQIAPEINPGNIEEALQQAVELELATIPTYLYTYNSIQRAWGTSPTTNQDGSTGPTPRQQLEDKIKCDLLPEHKHHAKELALEVQVYANKAAALIMSVVVEEMLHLALVSNVKQAIKGPPLIYDRSPDFPTKLPGHEPDLPINLAKFSKAQLITFLKIESPKPYDDTDTKKMLRALPYKTIGEFYAMIEQCIVDNFPGPYTNGRPQLVPGKNYYAQNTINTVYYDKNHKPQFPNADDSGDLIHVTSCDTALAALEEIVEQGEGNQGGSRLTPSGKPIIFPPGQWRGKKINPADYDDAAKEELSHFDRFLELYSEGHYLDQQFRRLSGNESDDPDEEYFFTKYFVYNQPDNPLTYPLKDPKKKGQVSYQGDQLLQNVSNFTNAVYSYILLMVETCYYQADNTQYEVFMMGIHKSMIWLLGYLGVSMSSMSFTDVVSGRQYQAAATFENYDFKKGKLSPKQQLYELAHKLPQEGDGNYAWLFSNGYLPSLPDVGLDHTVKEAPLLATIK